MALRAGVFLLTLSGLMFEVALTRIYSATIWYHFTFVAVSVALLGWGLGGFAVHVSRRSLPPSLEKAAVLSAAYAVAVVLCLWLIAHLPATLARLPVYFVAPLAPFLLAGMALSMIFDLRRHLATTLYFADLLGASAGALGVSVVLQMLGGEGSVLVAASAPFLASACFSRRLRGPAVAAAAAVALLATLNQRTELLHVAPGTTKAMRRQMHQTPGTRVTQTGWNAYSRIDAVEGLPGPLARLYIDSDAWTSIHRWDGRLDSIAYLKDSYRALPFRLEPNAEALVIGPGGGSDVVNAIASGSRHVVAVELNPLMIQFVRHYGARAGNIYDRPEVEVIQSEGRNFISRTDRRFDVILLGFVDSWAAVASGGLSLSENYLYTTEAFRAYYDHLTDRGLLAIIRWKEDIPRLVANSVALLGPRDASRRIVALLEKREAGPDDPPQMIFLLRKQPFTEAQADQIATSWPLAQPVLVPGRVTEPQYVPLLAGTTSLAAWDAQSPRRISAVYDDGPFYFATTKPWGMNTVIARILFMALVLPSVLLLAVFAWTGSPPRNRPAAPYLASLVYFGSLGFGFIAVELALLQHFTLLLGHPSFTLSVLLFTLLAAGGIGSAVSRRVPVPRACLLVAVLGVTGALLLPRLVPVLLPLPLWARVALSVGLITPFGMAMGMPFPRGLQRAGQGGLPAPPFYWGLNGIMSVIGSALTVAIAVSFGFRAAMLVGSLCYLGAALASPVFERAAREADRRLVTEEEELAGATRS